MKNKQAVRFAIQVTREAMNEIDRMNKSVHYNSEQLFYLKLGAEAALAAVATTVGANNSTPRMGSKWYLHSPRATQVTAKSTT